MDLFLDMARRLPRVKFALIGSLAAGQESCFRQLKAEAPPNTSFVVAPLRKVSSMLARAKVYVHCARNEHFGITIVEAMAAKCVPVVHNTGGPREIVTDKVGYRWTLVDDAVTSISNVINNEALRRELSEKATSRAELYRPEVFENAMAEVLGKCQN